MKTRLLLIRHGQSQANLDKRFAGHVDVPLTDLGRQQGKLTAEFLKNEKIDAVYSSMLTRAYDTACFTAQKHGLSVIKDAGVNEINGGDWENLTYPEIEKKFPQMIHIWRTNIGRTRCENGEAVSEVAERVYSAMENIAKKHPGQTVVIGCHGMAIRAFCLKVWGYSLDEMHEKIAWASNASVTYVDYENGKFTVIKYSEDQHLANKGAKTELVTEA